MDQQEPANASDPSPEVPTVASEVARPAPDDRVGWRAYWQAAGQDWRTEPEIEPDHQVVLTQRRALTPSIRDSVYCFAGMTLTRADVEWLLATHAGGRGPVDWRDATQRTREGLDLRGADLREVDLRGLPLARLVAGIAGATPEQIARAAARLTGADLRATHLEGADLRGASLAGADLRKALLVGADLRGQAITGVDLREADLTGANLRGAQAAGANLEEALLTEAQLAEAHLERARLRRAHLERAALDQAHLEEAILFEAHLEAATLRDAWLTNANLHAAHLEGAILRGAHLEDARLREAHLDGVDLLRAHMERANLESATLHGAVLLAVHLEGANLYAAHLEGKLIAAEAMPTPHSESSGSRRSRASRGQRAAHLPPADLRGAFFDSGSNLRHAVLGDQRFGYVSLADVTWGGANLAVVKWSRRGPSLSRQARALVLGDEREARQGVTRAGEAKDAAKWLAGYEAAVRANRQLAVALRAQGLDEDAGRFAYAAQVLQRTVLRREGQVGSWLFSGFLDLLAGYGYRPGRSVIVYLLMIAGFAAAYLAIGSAEPLHLSPLGALVFSVTSFHGRGFFPGGVALDDPLTVLAACEAIIGLIIEISFIATFTQRFFGK